MPPLRDMLGERSEMLEVIGPYRRERESTLWRCRCDCGNELWVRSQAVARGEKKHCGCSPAALRKSVRHDVEEIIRWREQGEKLSLIANVFGMGEANVSRLLKRRNVVPVIEPVHKLPHNART